LVGTVDEILAILFVVGLVAGVISGVRRRLVELEAARAQTLGVVSHEVRNHLTGVIGATELMLDAGIELTAEETTEMIGLAHGQAVEAAEVIEDLLVASRAERGVLDAVPEPVDLIPLTESVIRRSSVDGGHISIGSPDDAVWAMADALRYKQIIRNLLTNAFHYGGSTVEVSIQHRHEGVAVTVADDGEGIERAAAKGLFQPYHRTETAGRQPGSTGLGLWIARNLAQKMGGDLVYRRRDGFTLFELTLPAAQPPTGPTPHPSSISRTAGSLILTTCF
jgi:signal transduction histidine kinase